MPYASVNGLRLYYEEEGTGLPLVLLSVSTGILDSPGRGGWAALRPYLALRYRVVQFEQRGHGRTDNPGGQSAYTLATLAEDAAALIEHLRLAPAHVAGVSSGGIVGLALALTCPALLRSVVGIGTFYTSDAKTDAGFRAIDPDRLERENPTWAADLARRHDPHHAPEHWRELLRWIIACGAPAITVEDLQRITVPSLWIVGENDPWFELDQPLTMKRHIPGAELLIANHAGHMPQQTHPHLVGPAMMDFLNRNDGP